eukprot:c20716_g2_i1.p1 GENE.c20716_g2_i1~~c20716_g2_i1.p1  ORF type:complete len:584 (-),score=156.01 c20716_g2_i1:52-1770(-)
MTSPQSESPKVDTPSPDVPTRRPPHAFPGRPVQIVGVTDQKVHINDHDLAVFTQELSKHDFDRMAIVSVVGAMRTGKSFLLDVFVNFLAHDGLATDAWSPSTNEPLPYWLDQVLKEGDESLFLWRSSVERTTQGIWVYSTPFLVDHKDEIVAIVLMDTQGLFDPETDAQTNNTVFGISTLLSSMQILNIQNRVQENTLHELHMFTEYCHSALAQFIATNPDFQEKSADLSMLQHLYLLIRDWMHFTNAEDLMLCEREELKYLEESLRPRQHDGGSRDRILKSYRKVSCALLPHPGKKMAGRGWNGDLSAVDSEFIVHIDRFVRRLFGHDLTLKQALIPGIEMTPELFTRYLTAFVDAFTSEDTPKAETMVQALTKGIHLHARTKAADLYRNNMRTKLNEYLNDGEFEALHSKSKSDALALFDLLAAFGDAEKKDEARKALEDDMQVEREMGVKINRAHMNRLFAKYTVPVIFGVGAFAIDRLSDYVCDWWSSTCKDISAILFLIYFIIFGIVMYAVWNVYTEKGSVATVQGLSGLGSDCLEKSTKAYKTLKRRASASLVRMAENDGGLKKNK